VTNLIKLSIILGSVFYTTFGAIHIFWPKIFNWREECRSSKIVFSDTILTTNYYMSIQIIITGLVLGFSTVFFWTNKTVIITLLIFICLLLICRLIRAIVLPIRIPIKNVHNYFIFLFVCELVMFGIPLILLVKKNV